MIDFSIPPELEATRQRVIAFMDQYVYPNEHQLVQDEGLPPDLERELQETVKAQGLWAPNLSRESISRAKRLSWPNAQGFEPPRHQERHESKDKKQIKFLAQFDNY